MSGVNIAKTWIILERTVTKFIAQVEIVLAKRTSMQKCEGK